jgi:Fe-S cluster assembly protein SufD
MTLTEEYDQDCDQQQTMWLRLGSGSDVTHARNSFGGAALHWQFVSVQVQANGYYRMHNHALASQLRRQDTQIQLIGSGAHADLNSAVMVAERLNLDQQITIEHASAHTYSRQRVHNIVADRGKSTFNGRIHIHEGAKKSDAQLSNKNLGLGANATINTKPELEIYTDDVSCAHGATIGQLDNNQLFYLCSRGVAPEVARRLLCEGFLQQCVDGPLAEIAGSALVAPLHDMAMA